MQVISAHMYPMTTLHIIMLKGRRGAVGCTRNVEVVGSSPIKGPVVLLSTVGSRNGFERDFN